MCVRRWSQLVGFSDYLLKQRLFLQWRLPLTKSPAVRKGFGNAGIAADITVASASVVVTTGVMIAGAGVIVITGITVARALIIAEMGAMILGVAVIAVAGAALY